MYSYFKKSSDHEEVRIMSRAGDISHEKNVAIWLLRFIIVCSPFPSAAKKKKRRIRAAVATHLIQGDLRESSQE